MSCFWLSSQQIQRILLLATLCFAGCQSPPSLPSEDRVADFAAIKSKAADIQITTDRVPVNAARGKRFEIALHENTPANHDHLIVFVHGVFSDSRMWRYLCWDLASDYDVMAIDLLGCGESDRPDPADLPPDGYSPDALARDILAALRTRLAAPGVHPGLRITLVGHSLGAMTILNMWAEPSIRNEFPDVLDRVDSLMLLAPPDIAGNCRTPIFQEIDGMTDLRMSLADTFGILKRRCVEATITGVADRSLATREEADRLVEIFRHASTRHAGQAMLRQAIPHSKDRIREIVAGYTNVRIPCLIIWGAQDDLFPTSMGYNLTNRLPNAQLRIVNSAMHGLATERPQICASLLRDFLSPQHAATPKITVLDPAQPVAPPDHSFSTISSPSH
jgi:pimeloyl-ACP methyl ester carboxylesterase